MSEPIRVIYAKLTSTGSYDVVAMTSNIALERGTCDCGAVAPGRCPVRCVVQLGGCVSPADDGGHLIARFTPYRGGTLTGRESLMTDLTVGDDEDFARVRGNAFALVPKNERTFATLETSTRYSCPRFPVKRSCSALRELGQRARNFTTFAAAVLSTNRLLVLDAEPADHIELLTLLLPPRLRDRHHLPDASVRCAGAGSAHHRFRSFPRVAAAR
jgi:hypothetical protein